MHDLKLSAEVRERETGAPSPSTVAAGAVAAAGQPEQAAATASFSTGDSLHGVLLLVKLCTGGGVRVRRNGRGGEKAGEGSGRGCT